MDDQYIEKQLEKFNLTNAAISELKESYKELTIKNLDDKEGYTEVRKARLFVKNLRVDIDKRRKELTEDALKYQRAINGEAKRIVGLIKPIEDALFQKEEWYEEAHAKIKAEEERKQAEKIKARVANLIATEARFDTVAFTWDYLKMPLMMKQVKEMPDEEFDELLGKIQNDFKAFCDKRDLELAEAKALKEKQEAEFKREQEILAEERRKIAEREAAIAAKEKELARLDAERNETPSSTEEKEQVPAPVVEADQKKEGEKHFNVCMCGQFKVIYLVHAKDEREAKEKAQDIFNRENNLDAEVQDIEVWE